MQRDKMNRNADVPRLQFLNKRVAGYGEPFRHNTHHVEMPAVMAIRRRLLQAQLRYIPESLLIHLYRFEASLLHVIHPGHLRQRQRRLNVEHVVLVSRLLDVIAPGTLFAVPVPCARAHAMAGEHPRLCSQLIVIRHQRATLAAGEVLCRIKGEGNGSFRVMPDEIALVARLHSMRRILGEEQMVIVTDSGNGPQIRSQSGIMHWDNRFRLLRDLFLDLFRIDKAGVLIDIRKYGRRPHVQHRIGGRSEGQRRRNDLIPRPDALTKQRKVQRCGAGIYRDAMLRAHILGKFLLKFHGFRAFGPPA